MSKPASYGHRIRFAFRIPGVADRYTISWYQRPPYLCQSRRDVHHQRVVSRESAERFASKWGCRMP